MPYSSLPVASHCEANFYFCLTLKSILYHVNSLMSPIIDLCSEAVMNTMIMISLKVTWPVLCNPQHNPILMEVTRNAYLVVVISEEALVIPTSMLLVSALMRAAT